jgi:membrane-bound serine protease (ClpP class)
MRRAIPFAAGLLLILAALAPASQAGPGEEAPAPSGQALVYAVELDDAIQPVTAGFLLRVLDQAREDGASLVIVRLNTPGGLVNSTLEILEAMRGSDVPVAVHVAPGGAMAASAGFFMLMAAEVAAMAPETTTGAASVVSGIPTMPTTPQGEGSAPPVEDTKMKKATEILAAQMRSFAEARGRDPELVETAIFEAKAWSAEEALELGLVDVVAADRDELIAWLDGRTLSRVEGEELRFDLPSPRVVQIEMSWREKALSLLANPNIAVILFLAGILGIMAEVYHPGMIVPGVIGALCLLLFAFTAQILPISVVGVVLLLAAVAFFVAEVKVISHGLLTVGGIICLVLGGLMLIGDEAPDIPEFRVDPLVIVPIAVTVGLLVAVLLFLAVSAQRRRVTTGSEGLVGKIGRAVSDLNPSGRVFVFGEHWDARSKVPVDEGSEVRVVAVRDLLLEVAPADDGAAPPGTEGGS